MLYIFHICTSRILFFWSKYVLYYFLGQILFYQEGYDSTFHLSSSVWCSPLSPGVWAELSLVTWNPQKVAEMQLTAPPTGSEGRLLSFPLVVSYLGLLASAHHLPAVEVEVIWFLFLIEPALSLPSPHVKTYMWRKKSWSKPSRPSFCGFWSQGLWLESPRHRSGEESVLRHLPELLSGLCVHAEGCLFSVHVGSVAWLVSLL